MELGTTSKMAKTEARALQAEVRSILRQTAQDYNPRASIANELADQILESSAINTIKIRKGRNSVGVVLGPGDIFLKYRLDDPTRVKLKADQSVSNDEMAATRSLFDTVVSLTRPDISEEVRARLEARERRLKLMLFQLGRTDILRASREFRNLPGIKKMIKQV